MQSWTELALQAQRGRPGALDDLIDLTYDPIRRLCASLVNEASADDLAQETYLRVAKSIGRYRGESSAKTWLFSIAHHVSASHLRKKSRRHEFEQTVADPELSRVGTRAEPADDAVGQDALGRLTADRRSAFVLTQLYGLSYRETAEVCGCTTGTVASRVARARNDLIALLGVEGRPEVPQHRSAGGVAIPRSD
jgi:RNA polymerase sigma-70 factor (ECF subfamily)